MKLIKMALAPLAAIGVDLSASAAYLDVATDKDPIAYAVGETATMTFSASSGEVGDYDWSWKASGDDGHPTTDEYRNTNVARVTCGKPGFVRVEMTATPKAGGTKLSYTASVGFGVADIQPDGQRPEDLASFWQNRLKAIQDSIDPSKVTMEEAGTVSSCTIYKVRLDDLPDGLGPCTGWLTVPNDTSRRYPADALFYGYENSWSSDNRKKPTTADRSRILFRVMAHAFELEQDAAYYADFKAGTESRGKTHGLDPVQNANPLTSYFNGMACRDIRAMLFLKTLEAWDGVMLTATGHSQGGLQCIWAGLAPGVTRINPECPWNCNMYGQMEAGRVRDDRLHPAWAPGLAYYDPCFVGRLISPDCVVDLTRAGLADYCCPPSCVAAFFNTLPQEKRISWLQGSAHSQSSIPAVSHWFDVDVDKDSTFNAATDYPDTKEFVPVAEEVKWDDGFCGDISDLSDPTNRFVSYGGTWGANDQKYKMVQDALAKAKAGDVIWIHDGFVCEPDSADDYVSGGGSTRTHFNVAKAVTIRSVSGDARNHPNPPCFRGRWHDPDAVPVVKAGANAIRALGVTAAASFHGLVFENSSTYSNASYPGGCIVCDNGKKARFDKCVVRNNVSNRGALKSDSAIITDCVFSNNTGSAVAAGASVYNCYFSNNTGGACAHFSNRTDPIIVSNCTFVANKGGSGAGVAGLSSSSYINYWKVTDCVFSNNTATTGGGAIFGRAVISNCTFVGNLSQGNGGGGAVYGCGSANTKVYNCLFLGNRTETASGNGGAVVSAAVYGSTLKDNTAQGCGGGAASCVLDSCQIVDNVSTNPPGYTSSSGGLGGGVYGGSATNCVISGNRIWHNNSYCGRGGGAYSTKLSNCIVSNNWAQRWGGGYSGPGWCYNTLFTGNTSGGASGNLSGGIDGRNSNTGYDEIHLISCTVTGNGAASGYGGVHNVHAVNTISWGNGADDKDSFYSATNCCSKVLTDTETYPDCITADPVFTNNGFSDYELSEDDSPCVDAAQIFTWMLDETDPRSTAPNGVARIVGAKPDIGCFEVLKKVVPTTCTVTFDLGEHGTRTGGGELIQLVTYGEPAVSPEVDGDKWFAFDGWDRDFSAVTEDMAVTAVYAERDPLDVYHKVTFDLGIHGVRTGGGELEQMVQTYAAAVAPVVSGIEGWKFEGWDKDFSYVTDDMAVTALWSHEEAPDPVDGPVDISGFTDAKYRFVSIIGEWGANDQKYTSLQEAINKAKAGDVIYVHDGYVCDSGTTFWNSSDNRIYFDGGKKGITVRSASGVVDEAMRKGATIRGSKSEPLTRCLGVSNGGYTITFQGFIFENGASAGGNGTYGGGAVIGKVALYDCIVRNCSHAALRTEKTVVQRVVIEGCSNGAICNETAAYGLRDCVFRNNTASPLSWNSTTAADAWPVVSNCVFVGNKSHCVLSAHGSYWGGCEFRDCVWSNNVCSGDGGTLTFGGAVYGCSRFYNCKFFGNVSASTSSTSGGGAVAGYGSGKWLAYLYDCEVVGNIVSNGNNGASGGGVRSSVCYRTRICGNVNEGLGGGAGDCTLVDCEICDNQAVVPLGRTGSNGANGGGVYNCNMTNCIIRGNKTVNRGTHSSPGKGGGVYNNAARSLYNCLIVGNSDSNGGAGGVYCTDDAVGTTLYNCTVVSNKSSSCAGVRKPVLINSIVWDNTGAASTVTAATNSCCKALADTEKYPGCITEDPRFYDDGSWTLRLRSPCKDTAMPFKWMTDPADARSKDLAGNDRVAGAGPDMGCYERPTKIGMTVIVK